MKYLIDMGKFTNENRTRYYGLRVGDIVNAKSLNGTIWGKSKVLELIPMDNNKVVIESKNGTPIEWVAEWCEIVTKVEDIVSYTKGEWILKSKIAEYDTYANMWFCPISDKDGRILQRIYGVTKDEAEVNAKLIATAPELFKACERALLMLKIIRERGEEFEDIEKRSSFDANVTISLLNDVIKKATA